MWMLLYRRRMQRNSENYRAVARESDSYIFVVSVVVTMRPGTLL